MESWNTIINTSMIGTDKKTIGAGELPAELADAAALISANETIDKEERFLQTAALVFNYRQCGVMPVVKEQVSLSRAPAEEKNYCNNLATQVLKDVFAEDSIPLLCCGDETINWLLQGIFRIMQRLWCLPNSDIRTICIMHELSRLRHKIPKTAIK